MNKGITLTANHIKLIAILAMTADHLAWWLLPTYSFSGQFVHFIGRLTAPLMCMFIAVGCHYTSNLKRYAARLFVFAVLSHFPYVIYFGFKWYETTSVILTLLIGLFAASFYKRYADKPFLSFLFIVLCCILAYRLDWSYIAVLWIVSAYALRDNKRQMIMSFVIIGLLLYAVLQFVLSGFKVFYHFGFLLAVPVMLLYDGERGRKTIFTKWGFYVYYPLHLLILALLRYVIFA